MWRKQSFSKAVLLQTRPGIYRGWMACDGLALACLTHWLQQVVDTSVVTLLCPFFLLQKHLTLPTIGQQSVQGKTSLASINCLKTLTLNLSLILNPLKLEWSTPGCLLLTPDSSLTPHLPNWMLQTDFILFHSSRAEDFHGALLLGSLELTRFGF